ncbi:MAG: hypothetical protein IIB09_07440 [Bacteroidetes bacterium]|nr:hypothetical protein [Bacteroidota bacterium]
MGRSHGHRGRRRPRHARPRTAGHLYKGFYVTAAIVGALVLLGLHALGLPEPEQLGAAAVACSALRFYALVKNVNLPTAQRLPEPPEEMTLGSGG